MLRSLLFTAPVLALLATQASAQIRPVTIVRAKPPIITLQPQYNPAFNSPYSQAPIFQNPSQTINRPIVLPATWTPHVLQPTQITQWGVQPAHLYPGVYTPPQVATVETGRYYPVSQWSAMTRSGNFYDAWNDTFTTRTGTYQYNPWSDSYSNPINNSTYNPRTGVTVRPLNPVTNLNNFYQRNQYNALPGFIR